MDFIREKETRFFCNNESFNFLADVLQLVNDPKRCNTYELSDIEKMYRLLVKYYPHNVQYKMDLINFLYVVMDKEVEAINMKKEMQIELDAYVKYLNNIIDEI